MNTVNNEISFFIKPTLEFASALYILANNRKHLSLSKELGYEPDRLLFDMGEAGSKLFSKHMQKELYFFMYHDAPSMPGITPINALPFLAALDNPGIEGILQLIKHLESTSDDYFIYLMAKSALGLESQAAFKPENLTEYINNLPPEDEAFSVKLQECLQNPVETRVRFCLLLRQFYDNVYKPFEIDILNAIEAKTSYYEHLLAANPPAFVSDYFKIDLKTYKKRLDIYMSLFFQIGLLHLPWGDKLDVIILGIHSDKRFGYEVIKNRLINFYKLLSDEKRFQLLELISESPRYVNELAELLSLAPSTVSHHLGYFMRAGIVTPSRDEHKLYYALDSKKINELFERSIKMFVKG